MFFEQHVIGAMHNFGYVIGDPATKVAAVVDPSFDARILQKVAGENGYAIAFIFDTHHHPDHVFDNERLANGTGAKVAAHRLSNVRKDLVLEDGMVVKVGELKVKVVHTPGHSPDSCCYLVAGHAFTGDSRFERGTDVRFSIQQGTQDGGRPGRVSRPSLRKEPYVDDRRRETHELYTSAAHPRRVHPVHADALAGGKVRCDRQWRRLLLPRCSLHAALRLDLHLSCLLAFGFLRGTLHVQAEDPRRSASGDDLNHGMATGFATLLRGHDETSLRQRIRVVTSRVTRAPDEPLPVVAVPDGELARPTFLAATDEILLTDGRAIGRDAIRGRAAAIRVLDHRCAALRAVLFRTLDDPDLRQRVCVPASGVAIASEEPRAPPRSDDGQVPFLAQVAFADVILLPEGGLDLLTDRLAVRLEGLEDLAQHLLGFPDDVLSRAGPGRDGRHVGFQVGGHLGFRDPLRVILQGLDHGASARRRARILPLDELAVVQLLDDLVARRLRPESDPFHFLDEGPFAVPGRRFRAILADRYGTDAVQGFARRESRKDRLSDGPIRIVFPPSRILDPVTLGKEELASEIDLRFRRLFDGIPSNRGKEGPHDELVNGPMVVPLHLFSRNPLDRVDRRVVRRLGTASTRHDPLLRGEGPRLFRKGRILEFLEDRTEVHAGRIDRIVRARIRDVPRLVQILRDLHRLSRAKTDAVGLGDEHRRIERRGRTLFSLVLNVLADESLRRTLGQLEGGLRLRVRPKRPVLVIRFNSAAAPSASL